MWWIVNYISAERVAQSLSQPEYIVQFHGSKLSSAFRVAALEMFMHTLVETYTEYNSCAVAEYPSRRGNDPVTAVSDPSFKFGLMLRVVLINI